MWISIIVRNFLSNLIEVHNQKLSLFWDKGVQFIEFQGAEIFTETDMESKKASNCGLSGLFEARGGSISKSLVTAGFISLFHLIYI